MMRIVIVGGGPSGIVSGIFAKRDNNQVIVLERNANPLKKLLMTGSGKCNYLNEVYNASCYHSENMNVVDEVLSSQNIQDVKEFFDSIGLLSKVKNGYYYPYTFQAVTVEKLLVDEAVHRGVEIRNNSLVSKIEKKNDLFYVTCNDQVLECEKIVLACGSRAVPKTGSDGMGYQFLRDFSHTVVEPLPALVQLIGKGNYFKEWDGIRSEVAVELFENNQYRDREEGEIQLTSYGLSGICIFNLSHYVSRGLKENKREDIHINFVPFVDIPVTVWLDDYAKKNSYKDLISLLEGFLHYKLARILIRESGLREEDNYSSLTKDEKFMLCKNLRSFVVPIVGTKDFDSCQICSGGVSLLEVDSSTMESRIVPNLYIVGELLDMNGKCGGYNLTECWISGMLAGRSIGDSND